MRGVRAHSAITQRRGGGVASFRESVWRDAAILAAGLSRLHERGTADLPAPTAWLVAAHSRDRSEEHTSELQSLMRISYAVFCLKKKTSYNPFKFTGYQCRLLRHDVTFRR